MRQDLSFYSLHSFTIMTTLPDGLTYPSNISGNIRAGRKMIKAEPLEPMAIEPKDMLRRILSLGKDDRVLTKEVSEGEIMGFLNLVRQHYMDGPSLVEIEPPVNICGDIHGQFGDLIRLFNKGGFPSRTNYLFLGDYVDRGTHNLETILLLFSYAVYGFYEECNRRYSPRIWLYFQDTFVYMPVVGLVGGRILCMHGGISDKIESIDQLRKIERPIYSPKDNIIVDLLWADPLSGIDCTVPSIRGAGINFGETDVKKFCNRLGLDLIARGHQVVQDGYEFFADRHLVTIFSAPYYQAMYTNAAAMMSVDKDLRCSFIVMRPTHKAIAYAQTKEIITDRPVYKVHQLIDVKAALSAVSPPREEKDEKKKKKKGSDEEDDEKEL